MSCISFNYNLTKKVISVGSDGNKMVDIVSLRLRAISLWLVI